MSNPKEIKKRILSIESVIKTTEAMKMISVVKLRKIKDSLMKAKIYLDYIEKILLETKNKENIQKNQYFSEKGKIKLFIVFTSDRGLCGSFNSLIFEKINHFFQKKKVLHNECKFLSIGKKGFDFLNQKYSMYLKNCIENNLSNQKIQFLVSELISDFFQKKFSTIYLIYNYLKKSLFQEIILEKFLPVTTKNFLEKKEEIKK
ncbi:F0F1 ATP synthase subunit gamma [Blattabacterium sp. DPU]|uniref:F0F1 ATP synthase subunit gamma n=1 Tax=Blattabacterium sp. DPU TaxID=2715232 RepID=UPI001F6131D0|nr:F0F1 ATP synthase subunit gamma [Blattabacterium sp. DPU]